MGASFRSGAARLERAAERKFATGRHPTRHRLESPRPKSGSRRKVFPNREVALAKFERLTAGQLLKHVLGLAHVFTAAERLSLRYVWYDAGSHEAGRHGDEVALFQNELAGELDFRMTLRRIGPQEECSRRRKRIKLRQRPMSSFQSSG
jgi:hypothetical protein